MSNLAFVKADSLVKEFSIKPEGISFMRAASVQAVSGVSFEINRGETFALVGESGCGKSTIGRLSIGLLKPTSGSVYIDGIELGSLSGSDMKRMRSKMQIIFQDPYSSLNPRMRALEIVAEPLLAHKVYSSRAQAMQESMHLLEMCGISSSLASRYAHQFSGGQRQRIGIARALALRPQYIVCDEPVSALDVSIQSQIINLLVELQEMLQLSYMFISHDLSVVRYISDRVCVMFLGKVCEIGNTNEIFGSPRHPYTKLLLEAVPKADPTQRKDKDVLLGDMPSPINPPSGCRFHTRCPYKKGICSELEPALEIKGDRSVACHFPFS